MYVYPKADNTLSHTRLSLMKVCFMRYLKFGCIYMNIVAKKCLSLTSFKATSDGIKFSNLEDFKFPRFSKVVNQVSTKQ